VPRVDHRSERERGDREVHARTVVSERRAVRWSSPVGLVSDSVVRVFAFAIVLPDELPERAMEQVTLVSVYTLPGGRGRRWLPGRPRDREEPVPAAGAGPDGATSVLTAIAAVTVPTPSCDLCAIRAPDPPNHEVAFEPDPAWSDENDIVASIGGRGSEAENPDPEDVP
jgi:hypothetical protein